MTMLYDHPTTAGGGVQRRVLRQFLAWLGDNGFVITEGEFDRSAQEAWINSYIESRSTESA